MKKLLVLGLVQSIAFAFSVAMAAPKISPDPNVPNTRQSEQETKPTSAEMGSTWNAHPKVYLTIDKTGKEDAKSLPEVVDAGSSKRDYGNESSPSPESDKNHYTSVAAKALSTPRAASDDIVTLEPTKPYTSDIVYMEPISLTKEKH